MAGKIQARLREKGIVLPTAPTPLANYVPYIVTGNLVFIAGQGTLVDGELHYIGRVGQELTIEEGYQAARLCALNILAQVNAACGGDLDRVARVVKVQGFVNSAPDFYLQPRVINGASDLFVDVFGDAGKHARFAVGAPVLPGNIAVEVDAVVEIST